MSLPGGTHMSQPRFRYSMTVCVLALALVVPESAFSDAIRAAGRDAVPQTPTSMTTSTPPAAPSRSVTLTVPHECTGVPLTPVNFFATTVGSQMSIFSICRSTARRLPDSSSTSAGMFTGSFATTSRSLSGVVPPGTYQLDIYAFNQCGNGPVHRSLTVSIP